MFKAMTNFFFSSTIYLSNIIFTMYIFFISIPNSFVNIFAIN